MLRRIPVWVRRWTSQDTRYGNMCSSIVIVAKRIQLAFLNGLADFLQTCRKCRSSASAHSRYCVLPYAHGFMIHFSPAFIITVFQYSLIFIILDFHYRSFLWFSLSLWFSLFIVIVIFIIRLFHYCCVFITRSIIIPLFMHFFMISR